MSSDVVIRIEKLGKRYRYGGAAPLSYNLRAEITDWVKGMLPNWSKGQTSAVTSGDKAEHAVCHETLSEIHERRIAASPDYFWALKDINLEVRQGEVVGIIGRNGAGKSTLLKILSRITPPTTGKVAYYGRIASLLEVGTGFHRELTGRENIFLNGSILGMKRVEIAKNFDEIVSFAEVEKFIDTPVKFYSSGMYVRLAFAVAAHLNSEILLVDEVLAVGDASFQKKCLGKMGDVAKQGRTIMFVSHNMVAVQSLCSGATWLDEGGIKLVGDVGNITSAYLRSGEQLAKEKRWVDINSAPGNELCRIRSLRLTNEVGQVPIEITMESPFRIEVEYVLARDGIPIHLTFHMINEQGIVAFTTSNVFALMHSGVAGKAGFYKNICNIPGQLLNSGVYSLRVILVRDWGRPIYVNDDLLSFEVIDTAIRNFGWHGKEPGVLQPVLKWEVNYEL